METIMICNKCQWQNEDDAVLCSNCGEILFAIECPFCNSKIPANAIICPSCWKSLSFGGEEQTEEVVLGNEFKIKFNNLLYGNLRKIFEQVCEITDLHSKVRFLDASILKKKYVSSINKSLDYFINSARKALTEDYITFIKEKKDAFLSEDSKCLFELFGELKEKTAIVLEKVPNNTTGTTVKNFAKGFASAALFGIPGIVGAVVVSNIKRKKQGNIVDDWLNTIEKITEQSDLLYGKFCDLLDKIFEGNSSIVIEIDEEDTIGAILEEHLMSENSPFLFYSDIPANKKANAKSSYVKLKKGEEIICLYDSTKSGGSKEGICFSTRGIYWKSSSGNGEFIGYDDIKKVTAREYLYINGSQVEDCEMYKEMKKALDEIVAYRKG